MTKTDVVIAGAGPTGLMLACELRLSGVEVVVLDRLDGRSGESRAAGMHARTLEVLDQRGIVEPFIAAGRSLPSGLFAKQLLNLARLETRYPFSLMLLQTRTEALLDQRAAELGVQVRWSSEVAGLRQDETGVVIDVRHPDGSVSTMSADYLVGCDGGRSAVRKLAGISFPGTPATLTAMLGDVELADPPDGPTVVAGEKGNVSVLGYEPGWHRVFTTVYDVVISRDEPMTFERLRDWTMQIAGTDFGMHSPRWLSSFGDSARQAERFRLGRVLLAGDAAHIHFPAGGQGMNLGMQDAVNLGWKLGMVVNGHAPDALLDTYHDERSAVAARVLQNTRAQTALARPGPHGDALREVFADLVAVDDVNQMLAGMISALDIRYPLGDGHPLLGRRFPDLDLTVPDGEIRLFSLLHTARPVLLNLNDDPRLLAELTAVTAGWRDRLDIVDARCRGRFPQAAGDSELSPPAAVLIRPDGHTAWITSTGDTPDLTALESALTTWLGPANEPVGPDSWDEGERDRGELVEQA
ncbi:FAD-dependent monooxygenase [Micromonospora halophytica]|uniref:3-(3-hydroxy-phenyl)propionate hydroxylase n=1 Tax=Micromonospora halophytica TaxID=47864 RepID=A0A1C5ILI1_9ACTN|nr:FAD-dependent monooxygenase [Micromonospora halophytica]SCG58871.1 3-(3-hydroxy-phenyl)propionate hydroxylase [Micromonospora halophytica]